MVCCMMTSMAQSSTIRSLNVAAFAAALQDSRTVCLDVRTYQEYLGGHIEGAVCIDVNKPDFGARAASTLPKDRTIALYCRSGKRSKKAAALLMNNGYHVVELESGFSGWTSAGQPSSREETDLFVTDNGTLVYLYCLKHGSLRMKLGEQWVYVDPVGKAIPPAIDFSTYPKADIILITHEHQDHLDTAAVRQLTKDGTLIYANRSSCHILGRGEVMKNGDQRVVKNIGTVMAVPAYNVSEEKKMFHPKGQGNGYVLTLLAEKSRPFRIYIAGDLEDIPELAAQSGVDVAFLPCNLPYTMNPGQFVHAVKMVKPRVLFPYHYGNTNIEELLGLIPSQGIEVRVRQYQ